jgi:polysaccharide export outer membrane protein
MRPFIVCGDGGDMKRVKLAGRRDRTWSLVAMMVVLVAILAAAGCGSSERMPVRTEMVPFTPEQQQALQGARNAEYRLRDGDRLAVDFKYEDELDSTNLLVLPDGRLTLPGGVDPVSARGMTVTQLDSTLTSVYAVDYRDPELSVIIENLADLHVYVMGMVRSPGEVRMPSGRMGLLQAIASAGGFDESAETSEVVVLRATPDGFLLRQLDLSHLEQYGVTEFATLDLQPYDVIYVPRSSIGDFAYFTNTFMSGLLKFTDLFWDIYAVANIDKVDNIWR